MDDLGRMGDNEAAKLGKLATFALCRRGEREWKYGWTGAPESAMSAVSGAASCIEQILLPTWGRLGLREIAS